MSSIFFPYWSVVKLIPNSIVHKKNTLNNKVLKKSLTIKEKKKLSQRMNVLF